MADLILLTYDVGSRAAIVLCPGCGRVSRQILSGLYSPNKAAKLIRPHTCPICEAVYQDCNPSQAENWTAALAWYYRDADAYNQSAKEDFLRKAASCTTPVFQSAISFKPERYWYCEVIFNETDAVYSYISDIGRIETGEKVVVPFGRANTLKTGTVKSCKFITAAEAPYPIDKTKHILYAAAENDSYVSESVPPEFNNSGDEYIPLDSTLQQTTEKKEQFESSRKSISSISMSATGPKATQISPEEVLDRKIERWKRDLLDTSKRNRMINYRETKRATLRILEPEATELFNKLAFSDKPLTFQRPINKNTDLRTYSIIALMETLSYTLNVQVGDIKTASTIIEQEKTLKNLRSKAKLAQEEQGTNILYLCFGFIYWREHHRESSPWLKSPLLMMPVTLGIKSLSAPYTLSRYDNEIEVNPTLAYFFNTEYHIDLPVFELKNRQSIEEYFAQIEEIVDKRGWKVVREVSLGLLSFLKISMYHDLNNHHDRMVNHPVLRAMAGDRRAIDNLLEQAKNVNLDDVKHDEWHEVVDADSSQEEAILLSKLGASFVIQGPPGTGKSQTITNITAEALADGKKVLFVSEKAAALQVVLNRLTETRLDDFCLSLHNYKANKKEIIDSIGANLNLQEEYIDSSSMRELIELFHDRAFLNSYVRELHRPILPLDQSIYMAFGRISKLEKATALKFSIDKPTEITKEQYASILYCVSAFEKALHNMGGNLRANPWFGTKAISSSQTFKMQLLHDTEDLPGLLHRIALLSESISTLLGAGTSKSFSDVCRLLTVSDAIGARPSYMSSNWFTAGVPALGQETLREACQHTDRLHQYRNTILSIWDSRILSIEPEKIRNCFCGDDSWIYNTEGSDSVINCLSAQREIADGLKHRTEEIINAYHEGLQMLSCHQPDTAESIRMAGRVLNLIAEAPYMEAAWFDARRNADIRSLVDTASQHSEVLTALYNDIQTHWELSLVDVDDGILPRFRLEYEPSFLQAFTQYKADVSLLSSCAKNAAAIESRANVIKILACVCSIRQEKEWLEQHDSILSNVLGSAFQGVDSSWNEIEALVAEANAVSDAGMMISEAVIHADTVSTLTRELLKDWEISALALDADAMLARFKTEYAGLFYRLKPLYKEDIRQLRLHAKAVGAKIGEDSAIAFLQKLKTLKEEKTWLTEHQSALASSLGDLFQGEKTDWEAVRKLVERSRTIRRERDLISEAARHTASIREQLQTVLSEWNMMVLDIEADELIARFQKEYTAVFDKIRQHYEEDLSVLCRSYKGAALELRPEEAVNALCKVRAIKAEKSWFTDNASALKQVLGEQYRGDTTAWGRVREGISKALEITNAFPYSNISGETIAALLRIIGSLQLSGEVRRIAGILSDEAVTRFEEELQSCRYISGYSSECDITRNVLPQISSFIETCGVQEQYLVEFAAAKKDSTLFYEEITALLSNLAAVKEEQTWFGDQRIRLSGLFAEAYKEDESDWDAISLGLAAADRLISLFNGAVPEAIIRIACGQDAAGASFQADVEELEQLVKETAPKLKAFSSQFEANDFQTQEMTAVADRYDACMNGFAELNLWLDYMEIRKECDKHGLAEFTAEIAALDNTVADVQDAFERGFYIQWLHQQLDAVPAVQSFRKRIHEQHLERFVGLDEKQHETARKEIRNRIISTYPNLDQVTRAGSELLILRREMEKKSRVMPLRKLFQSIPTLLLTLKPCLMMSPLSVSYFLDADAYQFDMVIFDEASQIFPQDAIGAIFRAKQVVIAGDTWQLPPTNFFAASTSNSSDGYDDDEGYDEEVYDSILEEIETILPNRELLWHYRSKHEHLISFSNQEIYDNELVTFPSSNESKPDTGVEFVYVEDGIYEPSPKNCNIPEAQRIVELVKEHFEKHPDRSLGIIAFSEKQQQAIAFELQRFREKHSEYEAFFAEDREDELFVKNLENVQGDERDTIFFSVGYAKTKEQRTSGRPMSMRFGPLSVSGGERRLNVAITRAKINVKLVSSILPSDIDLSRTESDGIRMLRSYIEFAMNAKAALSAAQKDGRPDDFADSIAQFIRNQGFDVQQYVGRSAYKIDIAVRHPSNPAKHFSAGIECDGYSYASAKTARDRDRLRSSVLKDMGWNLYRVWSAEWYKNPEIEGQRLAAFLQGAERASDEKIKALEGQKQKEEDAKRAEPEKTRAAREAEEAKRRTEREETERKRREETERKAVKRRAEQTKECPKKTELQKASSGWWSLVDALKNMGFQYIDNYTKSSILWVLYEPAKKDAFERLIAGYDVQCRFEKRGALATNNAPAWRIMFNKPKGK